ncbi:hypothetical protein [Pedobacter sandarakinus]|uniref:hypothetical protein n=1 Tax=Pedobacter sandarakinus TaxID=353156 RepID=UPI0022470F99|nr:hypothetical protein [Pedobacter sandarakinus]MCX2575605.1 hypothetical protein [Pedobacter sandarakinus]
MIFLLLAVAGRITIYAMPISKIAKEIFKTNPIEKSDGTEKQDTLSEKEKIADVVLSLASTLECQTSSIASVKKQNRKFVVINCDLPIPEQPPK